MITIVRLSPALVYLLGNAEYGGPAVTYDRMQVESISSLNYCRNPDLRTGGARGEGSLRTPVLIRCAARYSQFVQINITKRIEGRYEKEFHIVQGTLSQNESS
jgi:hypothetical protein